jgi:flagellar biosynthetic protein FliR
MLTTGWLFFILGFDREIIRILAASFERFPAGSWAPSAANVEGIVRLGGNMVVTGVRLALPVAALLLLIDLALALLGRMQQQLQLLSLAFPAKMLAALIILAALSPMLPRIFSTAAERTMSALWRLLG